MKKLKVPEYEILHNLYVIESKSISSIAKLFNTSNPVVRNWLDSYNIKRRSHHQACLISTQNKIKPPPPKNELLDLYTQLSLKALQEHYSVSQSTIYQWLAHYNIPLRNLSHSVKLAKASFIESINIDKLQLEEIIRSSNRLSEAVEKTGYSRTTFHKLLTYYNIETPTFNFFRSKTEQLIFDYCRDLRSDLNWINNDRSIINPYELDIVCPDLKLAIEYCGIYWHSDWSGGKNSSYHKKKLELCLNAGYKLITIFETDDLQKVFNHIRYKLAKSERIYARTCKVKEVTSNEASKFNSLYHMQGSRGASIHLGLYHKNELVQLLSMGKSRYNKNYEWECIRLTSAKSIVGGASKLFKHFIDIYNPTSIITYSDRRFGEGNVYLSCGFNFVGSTNPGYFYTGSPLSWQLESRQKYQKHKLKDMVEHYDDNLTETELMKLNNYDRIWDCGHNTYSWTK